jgi:Tfp pilus assembly protein PilF
MDPKSGEAHTLLGVAYDRKGLGAAAREAFETALHDPNDEAMHLNNLGFLLYRQGYFDESIKHLKRAAKLNPTDPKILNNLTLVQLAAEKYDDAYKSSVHALGEFDARVKIARELAWHGHEKDAIKQLEKARALQPDSVEVLSQLARLYDSTGRDEKAQQARERLVSLQTVASTPK